MSDDDPFDGLPADGADGDVDAAVEELFTEVDVEAVDDEAVWDELTGDASSSGDGDRDGVADRLDHEAVETDDGEGTVVPKESYCQQCEHFSPPPQVSCADPGTEILELVDVEHFRVEGCPVVERRHSATRDIGEGE